METRIFGTAMEKIDPSKPVPDSFVDACKECGTASHDRQYVRVLGRHTCENCLLDSRKRVGGLEGDPYESFVEALAEAIDLRAQQTGLHSKRVASHTVLLATHFFKRASDLKDV